MQNPGLDNAGLAGQSHSRAALYAVAFSKGHSYNLVFLLCKVGKPPFPEPLSKDRAALTATCEAKLCTL